MTWRDVFAATGVLVAWSSLGWLACAVCFPPASPTELASAGIAAAVGSVLAIGASGRA